MEKITLSIIFATIFFASNAQVVETVFSHPKIADGIYVDDPGNIYTTSGGLSNGIQIGKYDINTSTYNQNFATGFSGPINIATYRDSLFIVSNYDNSTVYSYNLNSFEIDTLASGLDGPAGITIDSNDNIYVSNWGQAPTWAGHQINKISSSGSVSLYVDSSALYRPQAITINHLGELIVHSQQKLYKIDPTDSTLYLWTNVGNNIGNMTFRKKDSCIYGASNLGNKIIKVDHTGGVSIYSGSTQGYQDGGIDSALFNSPIGVAFTVSEDTLYISEGGTTNRLRRIIMNQTVGIPSQDILKRTKIFPNPSKDVFIVEIENNNDITFEVFNSSGKKIFSDRTKSNRILLDLSHYPEGNYLVKFSDGDQISSKKIVKL